LISSINSSALDRALAIQEKLSLEKIAHTRVGFILALGAIRLGEVKGIFAKREQNDLARAVAFKL
jgi:hypothetical protein